MAHRPKEYHWMDIPEGSTLCQRCYETHRKAATTSESTGCETKLREIRKARGSTQRTASTLKRRKCHVSPTTTLAMGAKVGTRLTSETA